MDLPSWCAWTRGESAVLLVAPHGGRRPPVDATAPPPNLRVNDVYTPEVTELLAVRLGAATVINRGQDRNTLDLNRTSQVLRRAPWFLALLVRQLAAILERHATAEVLVVHGWNVGQAKCDIGIGAVEREDGLHLPAGAMLTVSDGYRRARIASLRAACAAVGIAATIGERYAASHRNNLLQLFTPRGADDDNRDVQQLAIWATAGRLQAVQLELGIPLRWPGPWRDRFVDALTTAFEGGRPAPVAERRAPLATPRSPLVTASLQLYDPAADIGVFAGVGRVGPRASAGRLLLFLGGQRIALFTGDNVHGGDVEPLRFSATADGMCLQFAGPLMRLADAAAYLDLEGALAASQVVEARVDLQFAALAMTDRGMQYGAARGTVAIDGGVNDITAGGFANAGGLRAAGSGQQTMLAADFGAGCALLSRASGVEGQAAAWHFARGALHSLDDARVAISLDGDPYTPRWLELTCAGHPPLRCQPLSRMPILRPAGQGSYLRVTFGVARYEWGGEVGWGLYEHAVPLKP